MNCIVSKCYLNKAAEIYIETKNIESSECKFSEGKDFAYKGYMPRSWNTTGAQKTFAEWEKQLDPPKLNS